jgi:hypothetical protein
LVWPAFDPEAAVVFYDKWIGESEASVPERRTLFCVRFLVILQRNGVGF